MDQQAFCKLYETYKNGVFRYILSIVKNSALAEDILQDTFVKVLTGGLRCAPGKEQAWLYRVSRNLCYDRLRRLKKEQTYAEMPEAQNECAYMEMIASLSPKDREIVTLRIVGGLSHKEIGRVLGITAGAAQKRYERAIAILRSEED
ncbi:MAG: RNA polymerase sigma factor [Oscillospiraceae bacterium]|nr:RNA polymerase sigma factor [Oscillospiraceae bacterium]